MDVERLEAGRELDIMLAELVTGQSRLEARVDPCNRDGEPQFHWGYPVGHDFAPQYSISPLAATTLLFELLKRFKGQFLTQINRDLPNRWIVTLDCWYLGRVVGEGATIEMAICKAALKALLSTQVKERETENAQQF